MEIEETPLRTLQLIPHQVNAGRLPGVCTTCGLTRLPLVLTSSVDASYPDSTLGGQ